jgi:dsDNA-specific endonuclease/ATPase MutS2
MNKFKKFIIPGTLALSLLGATSAFAAATSSTSDTSTEVTSKHNREARKSVISERQAAHATIIENAEDLIPGSTADYEAVKSDLTTVRESISEQMDALKAKVKSGEITKEELKESLGSTFAGRGNGNKSSDEHTSNPWTNLETAIEAKDTTSAQTALDSILAHMNSRLAAMTERLEALK